MNKKKRKKGREKKSNQNLRTEKIPSEAEVPCRQKRVKTPGPNATLSQLETRSGKCRGKMQFGHGAHAMYPKCTTRGLSPVWLHYTPPGKLHAATLNLNPVS